MYLKFVVVLFIGIYLEFLHTSPIEPMLKKCDISNNNSQFLNREESTC